MFMNNMWFKKLFRRKAPDENTSLMDTGISVNTNVASGSVSNLYNDATRGAFNVFDVQQQHDPEKTRLVFVNDEMANVKYGFCDNSIKTTKYTFYNFLFKNLYQQFHRFANCYFLFMALLQTIPGLSPTGQFTAFIPLCFVLICTMCKDAYEDIKRRVSDKVTNNKLTRVFRDGQFVEVFWKDVKTGDILQVYNKEPFPCDIVLLSSSEHQGICYVETSSLDGETNLKIKRCKHETTYLSAPEALKTVKAILECEKPNNRLYKFEGTLVLSTGKKLAVDPEQICLRGSSLRNTDFVIGVAVFTGHDTKLMMNTKETPHKTSKIERMTNQLVFIMLAIEILLVIICDIGLIIWTARNKSAWYLFAGVVIDADYLAWSGFKGFFTILVLLSNLIPISLYVSIEAAKLVQGIMISKDLAMYHEDTDTPAMVRSSALNEDLGAIQYIFSDKTGTLTQNKMDFLKCSIAGEVYGSGITEIAKAAAKREGKILEDTRPLSAKNNPNFQFYDERLMDGAWKDSPQKNEILDFLILLAVCHTVIPERSGANGEIVYQASSPDEAALVKAAKYLGVEFIARSPNDVTFSILGEEKQYQILDIIEFSSDRKRQSVIVRNTEGQLLILTKGADSVIYPLLAPNQEYMDVTLKHLDQFGDEGLRTLCCAKAYLDEEEYAQWHRDYEEAKTSLEDRTRKVEEVAARIEKNLLLVGSTGIEDKLQEGVGDTIYELRKAGINIWVLTGDKLETAINIGFACDLLNSSMTLLVVEGHTNEAIKDFIEKSINTANMNNISHDALGLVVDGERLIHILEDPALKNLFLLLSIKCKSVICCRVSPKQKSDVVLLIKQNVSGNTLAIGDGANDVAMIQSAHVGIGISGVEGLQAVNASDYAIGQFRFLKRLLLVHGRWSYRRVSKLVLYCFYKNTVFFLTQLWFIFFNGFSGTTLHDKWTIALYNLVFSGIPIITLAVIDRDVPAPAAEKFPELYFQGQKNRFFNPRVFIYWVINSIFQSVVCFFVPYFALVGTSFLDGQEIDTQTIGIAVYSCVLVVITVKLSIETSSWTWVTVLMYAGTLALWPAFIFIYGSIYYIYPHPVPVVKEFYEIMQRFRLFFAPQFWFVLLAVTFICCIRDIFWKLWLRAQSRKLYYDIQKHHKKKSREDIMEFFPFEEGLPVKLKKKKKFNPIELQEIKKIFTSIAKVDYRGFAFSQTDNQQDLIKQYYSGDNTTNNGQQKTTTTTLTSDEQKKDTNM